jgi:phosphatidylglycerophosphate synthase
MALIPKSIEIAFDRVLIIPVQWLRSLHLSPNMISTVGIIPSVIAAFLLAYGYFVSAGILILIGGLLDMMDGKLARLTNRVSKFGALYDSTLDRLAEIAMYIGLGYYFVFQGMHFTSLLVVIAAGGSVMVSYVRARAESHGFTCNVGLMRRGERIVLLGVAAFVSFLPEPFDWLMINMLELLPFGWSYAFPPMPLTLAIGLVAILTPITVGQRIYEAWKQVKAEHLTTHHKRIV